MSTHFPLRKFLNEAATRFSIVYRKSPSYLAQSSLVGSLLWIPYSVTVTGFLAMFVMLSLDRVSQGVLVFFGAAAFYVLLSLALAVWTGLVHDRPRPVIPVLRALLWLLSLPARSWVLCFILLGRVLVQFWWILTLLCMVVAVLAVASDGFQASWSNTARMLALSVGVCFIVVGGRRWGNQYGSGVVGGIPLGCVIVPIFFLIALIPMLFVAGAVLGGLFLPAVVAGALASGDWGSLGGVTTSMPSLVETDGGLGPALIALAVALVSVVLPIWFECRKKPRLFAEVVYRNINSLR